MKGISERAKAWALLLSTTTPVTTEFIGAFCESERSSAAQRNYVGAVTCECIDQSRGKFFHTNWTGKGGATASSTYNV